MESKEEIIMQIEISNEKRRFIVIIPFLIISYCVYPLFLPGPIIHLVFLALMPIFWAGFLYYILHRFDPWDKPNQYLFTESSFIYDFHSYGEDNYLIIPFSRIRKIVYKYIIIDKSIEIHYRGVEEERKLKIITAPMLEDCKDKWQQLFEEIRKRIPPEAEVVVK